MPSISRFNPQAQLTRHGCLLHKAWQVAERIMPALESDSGVPSQMPDSFSVCQSVSARSYFRHVIKHRPARGAECGR